MMLKLSWIAMDYVSLGADIVAKFSVFLVMIKRFAKFQKP